MMSRFPERTYDVGIAEQHATVFACGLAIEGYRPVCAIYSTFLQRAFDPIVHDVAIQGLPVVFAIDRGGLVGDDGPTHHGAFDIAYLRSIPGLTVMAPMDEAELVDDAPHRPAAGRPGGDPLPARRRAGRAAARAPRADRGGPRRGARAGRGRGAGGLRLRRRPRAPGGRAGGGRDRRAADGGQRALRQADRRGPDASPGRASRAGGHGGGPRAHRRLRQRGARGARRRPRARAARRPPRPLRGPRQARAAARGHGADAGAGLRRNVVRALRGPRLRVGEG